MDVIKVNGLTKEYKVFNSRLGKLTRLINPFSKNLYKEYRALDNVSFTIGNSESVGIIGHNGAGKSTLLKLLTGVAFPSAGTVEVAGRIASLLELGTGFNPELTGIENIYFNGSLMGMSDSDVDNVLEEIISFADIGEFIFQPVKHYSSGMFARLAFAVSINVDPDVLIVDEILSVGDVAFQKKCLEKFDEFRQRGKTIIYVSHNLDTIKRYCTKAIWLDKGKVEAIGNPEDVIEAYYRKIAGYEKLNPESNKREFVELVDMKALNSKNELLTEFSSGEEITLKVRYNVLKEDIINPGIYIALRKAYKEPMEIRELDKFLFAVNSNVDGVSIPWKKGENSATVRFKSLKLGGGRFYFDVIFLESQNLVSIESVFNALDFNVVNEPLGKGYVFLDNKWA